jgi:galactokinase
VVSSYAPGRAELLGNHTDYNGGFVLAIAVDRGTTLSGSANGSDTIRVHSRDLDLKQEIALGRLTAEAVEPWSRYVLGVVDQFKQRGLAVAGFDLEISGNLPLGAGLSSSASLENATTLFLSRAFGAAIEPLEMAKIGQAAENQFVGVMCGLLDQMASLMGRAQHATFIDCRSFDVRHVPVSNHVSFIIANSGVKHALVGGEYNERRLDCEAAAKALGVPQLRDVSLATLQAHRATLEDRSYRRALHIVGENERVLAGCEALEHGDLKLFGELMFDSHESSRVNFENSCPELDRLVETARGIAGVYGARLSGGGFGGATINLVEAGREAEVVAALEKALPGTSCLVTCAADGALASTAG